MFSPLQTNHRPPNSPCQLLRHVTISICGIVGFFQFSASDLHAQRLKAERVLRWDFTTEEDRNLDGLPDGWRRRRDRQHPFYIEQSIVPREQGMEELVNEARLTLTRFMHAWQVRRWESDFVPEVAPPGLDRFIDRYVIDRCLQVDMKGDSWELVSPTFPLDVRFAYCLNGAARAIGLHGHELRIELQLLDSSGAVVDSIVSDPVSGDQAWGGLRSQVTSALNSSVSSGRIHLHVRPIAGANHYTGTAQFDALTLVRLPRMTLTTNLAHNVGEPSEDVNVRCHVMGIRQSDSDVAFDLLDVDGNVLQHKRVPLREMVQDSNSEPARPANSPLLVAKKQRVFDGVAVWDLRLREPGLYRVRASLGRAVGDAGHRELWIAMTQRAKQIVAGPFGWSLPKFSSTFTPGEVPTLVRRFGAGKLKISAWFDSVDFDTADQLIEMAEILQALGTECIGRLDHPPEVTGNLVQSSDASQSFAVSVFRDPETWESSLEPVITRIGLKINWLQLGGDDDYSIMENSDPRAFFIQTKERMSAMSQELKMVMKWNWLNTIPEGDDVPWDAVHFTEKAQLTADELRWYLASVQDTQQAWVSLDPLPSSKYSLLDRIRDLTERMIVVKEAEVPCALVSHPFDLERGLFTSERNAGEMLLPWKTLVETMGDGDFAGSIQLPSGSSNFVFDAAGRGSMILWNDQPCTEQLYLGENIEAHDVWGRPVEISTVVPRQGMIEQQIVVGPWPILLRGVDVALVRWRQNFELKLTNLASAIGLRQEIPLEIKNTFSRTVTGKMTLHCDTLLKNGQVTVPLHVPAEKMHQMRVPIAVRSDASAGDHQLRFDFDIRAGRDYHFSTYRSLTLGLGDIDFDWEKRRVDDEQLLVQLQLINNTDMPVSFDCKVFPPGQPYQRFQVLGAEPGTTQRKLYLRIPDSHNEEIWVQCEQIGTGRILNYRIAD